MEGIGRSNAFLFGAFTFFALHYSLLDMQFGILVYRLNLMLRIGLNINCMEFGYRKRPLTLRPIHILNAELRINFEGTLSTFQAS